jgi:hypothetical protein
VYFVTVVSQYSPNKGQRQPRDGIEGISLRQSRPLAVATPLEFVMLQVNNEVTGTDFLLLDLSMQVSLHKKPIKCYSTT